MADEDQADEAKTTTIKISKDNDRFGNRVPVSVNGAVAHLPIDTETPVGDHVLEALNNAGITYSVVSPEGEQGASVAGVASEAPVEGQTGTANRLDVHNDERPGEDSERNARENPEELKQDGGTIHIEGEIPASAAAVGGDTGGNNGGNTAAETAGDTGGANANGTSGADTKQNEEPGLLDKSIPDLTEALKSVTSTDELDKLLAAEKAGKSRSGATAAIEARKAELTAA